MATLAHEGSSSTVILGANNSALLDGSTLKLNAAADGPSAFPTSVLNQLDVHLGNPSIKRIEISFREMPSLFVEDVSVLVTRLSRWVLADKGNHSAALHDLSGDTVDRFQSMNLHKILELSAGASDLPRPTLQSPVVSHKHNFPAFTAQSITPPAFNFSVENGDCQLAFRCICPEMVDVQSALQVVGNGWNRIEVDLTACSELKRTEGMLLATLSKKLAPEGSLVLKVRGSSSVAHTLTEIPGAMKKMFTLSCE